MFLVLNSRGKYKLQHNEARSTCIRLSRRISMVKLYFIYYSNLPFQSHFEIIKKRKSQSNYLKLVVNHLVRDYLSQCSSRSAVSFSFLSFLLLRRVLLSGRVLLSNSPRLNTGPNCTLQSYNITVRSFETTRRRYFPVKRNLNFKLFFFCCCCFCFKQQPVVKKKKKKTNKERNASSGV